MNAEMLGRLAPAAAGVEERGEGLDEPGIVCGLPENAIDERVEGGIGQVEEQLERAEIVVGGYRERRCVERRPRLEEAPAQRSTREQADRC